MKQVIAAFDFDGTITTKDTLWEFLKTTHSPFEMTRNLIRVCPFLLLYKMNLIDNERAKQRLFSAFYRNWPSEKFNDFCISFKSVIDGCLRPEIYQNFKKHKQLGHRVIIVSASIENWILPWAKKEGINTIIATQIETNEQELLTGFFSSPNCYGKEKARRILEMFPEREKYTLIAYGDSKGDLEMLHMADERHYIK